MTRWQGRLVTELVVRCLRCTMTFTTLLECGTELMHAWSACQAPCVMLRYVMLQEVYVLASFFVQLLSRCFSWFALCFTTLSLARDSALSHSRSVVVLAKSGPLTLLFTSACLI